MPPKSPRINLDKEVIDYVNYLRVQHGLKELKLNEQALLSGALEGKKYEVLAEEHNIPIATLRQKGSALFKWLSSVIPGIRFKKTDFKLAYPKLLELAKAHFAAQAPSEVSGLEPPVSGGFYGRNEEIEQLEKLLQYVGSIVVLSGMNGIGRRSLVSHCLQTANQQLLGTQIVWVHPSHKGIVQQSYTLLDVDEQGFTRLLQKGKYVFIFENGESLEKDSQGIDFLRTIQHLDSQAIVISTIPLDIPFATEFSLPGLAVDDAMLIVKEFDFKGSWWRKVVESLGGNPGFIRQYLSWVKSSLGEDQKELILRETVQFSFISRFLGNLLESFSEKELAFLKFIAQSEKALSMADILHVDPTHVWLVEDLLRRGLIEKRIISTQQAPKRGRNPVYSVPSVLKKYISDEKQSTR